ncbi:MAG: TIGR04255 family protein [Actinobacteria bacterium]|nr:TIGR04255 family protein [Actinomycetota bacterium]
MSVPDLISYAQPPVVEVVAAVRFEDLSPEISAGLSEFWRSKLANELPEFALQAPYHAPVEQFDRRFRRPEFSLDLQEIPPTPRFWFSAKSGDELIQLQPNWLAYNWRKATPDAQYSRWASRREVFLRHYLELAEWLAERGASITPDQCEVTYINHIYPIQDVWATHADAHMVFRGLQMVEPPRGLRAEQAAWQAQYLIGEESETIGRLHINVQPAFSRRDDTPIFVMELTARGVPPDPSLDGIMQFLDRGRSAVVGMFDKVTTPEAHKEWGKE